MPSLIKTPLLLLCLAGCAADESTAKQQPDSAPVICALCQLDSGADGLATDSQAADSLAADRGRTADGQRADGQPAIDASTPLDGLSQPPDTIAKPYVHEDVTPAQVAGWLAQKKPLTLVDVREPDEFAQGHIEGAINLPLNSGVLHKSHQAISQTLPVVVYCRSGARSDNASTFLANQGYQPVYDLGGILGWTAAGYPVVK